IQRRVCLMQPRCSAWKGAVWLVSLLVPVACLCVDCAQGQPAKGEVPRPLTEETVKVWQEAGAEVGWIGLRNSGFLRFFPEMKGEAGDWPGFRFEAWKEGLVAHLPVPEPGFGLDFSVTKVTDADLNGLPRMKTLQALRLSSTRVTDAGLK